ncbi:hypothetical protein BV898_12825 [Hypsibius exemplaris]|uniref:Intradiol ring-cleavage dioxygenases domain-containing protein n=1 Tax=Hypsibius exemplaris TaxID=2072580 RepID=A0A1W0WCM4_HYPEX|nr:hypothetical protein BV898_12825 [Hypsibius exemplaris]
MAAFSFYFILFFGSSFVFQQTSSQVSVASGNPVSNCRAATSRAPGPPPGGRPGQRSPNCSVRSGQCMTTQCVEEGPYYKACSPLEQMGGQFLPQVCTNSARNDRLFINGTVRLVDASSPCGRPVRALLDIWHADAVGVYSNTSPASRDFTCRKRLITTSAGFFAYSTIMPGRYGTGRSEGYRATHVHVKVTPLDQNNNIIGPTLTTQQYFAHDLYAGAKDQCNECHSEDPTLVVYPQHSYDVKTYDGTWDILLPRMS